MFPLRKTITLPVAVGLSLFALASCSNNIGESVAEQTPEQADSAALPALNFEKMTLDNGLEVVLHIDRSDPLVAINLAVHVGSGRENVGKTGFAHLFEHLLFMDSENLGYGGLDEMNTRIGGEGTNGFTTNDMTQYFQAVPKDGLEKVIWAEADKLGYFIKTVNQNIIDREKQVVKNEKRQRVDNRPYGHNFYVIGQAIYPEGHPYHHQVIGSLEDLENATLEDTKAFFNQWYRPDNVTVTLAGDFELEEAKALIKKYFGEIPSGAEPTPATKAQPVTLSETKHFVHEDNFATLPQLTLTWPAVPEYHPDSYALNVLMTYLVDGKEAPMNQVLIDEKQLTTNVSGFNYTKELAGEVYLFINPKPNEDIDNLLPAVWEAFARFEESGIPEEALTRIKTKSEVSIFDSIQSALGKAIAMGEYNLFTGNPGFLTTDIKNLQAVTAEDVMNVYNKYIKGQHYVSTSFTPKDQTDLALDGAQIAKVVEEVVVQGAEKDVPYDPAARVFEPTASSFDRSVEPPFGDSFVLPSPTIWDAQGSNGLQMVGIQSDEVPLIEFSLEFDAGKMRSPLDKPGLASITGDMLTKGAGDLDVAAFEKALGALGSSLTTQTRGQYTLIRGKTLARNLDETVALLQDMINAPQFDENEFKLLQESYSQTAVSQLANPDFIAAREMASITYAEPTALAVAGAGTEAQINAITLDDVKAFHKKHYAIASAKLNIVGNFDEDETLRLFSSLEGPAKEPLAALSVPKFAGVEQTKVYFYDVPGAKQSVLRMSRPALPVTDENFTKLEALNFPLGRIYTSKLMTELRVNKGYTYGIRSFATGNAEQGQFGVGTSVRTNVTLESLSLINEILGRYSEEMTEAELAQTKDALLRGQALKNETLGDKLGLVQEITRFDLPYDAKSKNMEVVQSMSLEEAKAVLDSHVRPDAMNVIVVGDAATQLERLEKLGFGKPIPLN